MTILDEVVASTPLLQDERPRAEASFAMTSAVMERLGPLGVFRLTAKDRQTDLGSFIRITEELAFADPSVAWAATNSNGAAMATHVYPDQLASELLAEENWFFGVGFPPVGKAQRDNGRLRVTGRWPVVSGCEHASHFVLNCVVHENEQMVMDGPIPEMGFVAIPKTAVQIQRTWEDVTAVKGSGSHAVAVDGYETDGGSIATLSQMTNAPTTYGGLPGLSFQSMSLAAVAMGIGRAAVNGAVEQASTRISVASGKAWADAPSVQDAIASADIAVEVGRQGLFALADHTWAELVAGNTLDRATNARLHSVCDHAFRTVRRAVSDLFATGSVDAIRSGHILEQSLRDIHGFSVQWERYRQLHYHAARGLMGFTVEDPQY